LENTDYIWTAYARGCARGKVCVVFDFARLRESLNQALAQGNSALEYSGIRCHQFFSINYGVVEYVAWDAHRINTERLPNPISYTYLKSDRYREDRELRISLAALGIGQFMLNDGSKLEFPTGLQMGFDFRSAFMGGAITQILYAQDCDRGFLRAELDKLRILAVEKQADAPLNAQTEGQVVSNKCRGRI
jgi:hypothetical protein